MNRFFDKLPIIGKILPGKITLSFIMFLFAVVMWLIFKTADRMICIIAMFFSLVGDIALNHKRNHDEQTKTDLLVGGIAFIVAHLCYCTSYYQKIGINNYVLVNFGFVIAVALLIIITISILATSNPEKYSKLFLFAIAYLWLTGINYTTIFSYAYSAKSFESIVAFGGILFFLSDLIIGLEKFYGLKSKLARELVWWLYPIGQLVLIAMA